MNCQWNTRRTGLTEYVCANCGHTVYSNLPAERLQHSCLVAAAAGKPATRAIAVAAQGGVPFPRDSRARIVHLMTWPMWVGGASRMVHEWCVRNCDVWDVHVVSCHRAGLWDWSGVTVHTDVPEAKVAERINELAPDLLVNHTPFTSATPHIKCPQVWIMHGMPFLRMAPPQGVRPVCVFSNLEAPDIHPGWHELGWRVLPIGVDLNRFVPASVPRFSSAPGSPLTLGIVGRLHPEKFPPDPRKKRASTLTAALHAWDRGPWRLQIIGQGLAMEWQNRFRREVADLEWIEFLPDVLPAEVPRIYHQLDALLVPTPPTTGETGCYSAVEAMASGVPVVARDVPGLRQSCRHAALYGTSDEELLAAVRLLDDPDRRRHLAQAGRQVAADLHDLTPHLAAHGRAFSDAMPVDVSVLTAVYNTRPKYLRECWDSLRRQTYRRWELLLIDDGSTEAGTLEVVAEMARDPRVRLLRLPENQGAAAARNAGLAKCRADFVAIMDSDDVALPEWLEKQMAWITGRPGVAAVGVQIVLFDEDTGREMYRTRHPAEVTRELIDQQRRGNGVWFINHPGAVYRRQAVLAIGGYPAYSVGHDLGMWLRLFLSGARICNSDEILIRYRKHDRSLTHATADRLQQYSVILREVFCE